MSFEYDKDEYVARVESLRPSVALTQDLILSSGQQDTVDRAVLDVKRDGYAIVANFLDANTLARVQRDMAPIFEMTTERDANKRGRYTGIQTVHVHNLFAKTRTVDDIAIDPVLLHVIEGVLGDQFQMSVATAMCPDPGVDAQGLHQDDGHYPLPRPRPPFIANSLIALDDFSEANGATRLVPGSHLWRNERVPKPAEVVATEMTPGSVLIYTGNVIHGGGANHADQPRTGVALHYNLGWLRQEENQYLAVPQEIARKLPDQVQELMGYALGSSSLGFVDHIEPKDYLHGVRDQAKSSLGPPELRQRVDALNRLHFSHTEKGNLRYYDIDTD